VRSENTGSAFSACPDPAPDGPDHTGVGTGSGPSLWEDNDEIAAQASLLLQVRICQLKKCRQLKKWPADSLVSFRSRRSFISRRLKFTVRRHKLNNDSLSLQDCRVVGEAWPNMTRPAVFRESRNRYVPSREM